MYYDFYQLNQAPFPAKPGPHQVFLCPSHTAALDPIVAGITNRSGPMALIGQAGLGKTTLLRASFERLEAQRFKLIDLQGKSLNTPALLQQLYHAYNLTWSGSEHLSHHLQRLSRACRHAAEQGLTSVLVLDNAHEMPLATLETVGLLSANLDQMRTPMPMLLVGQPLLENVLRAPSLSTFASRLTCVSHLYALSPQDSLAYIRHGLTQAGGDDKAILSSGARKHIVRCAGGVPRNPNIERRDRRY